MIANPLAPSVSPIMLPEAPIKLMASSEPLAAAAANPTPGVVIMTIFFLFQGQAPFFHDLLTLDLPAFRLLS